MGYRSEQLYGEGYKSPSQVIAYEIFEMGNTDVLETLCKGTLKDSPLFPELHLLMENINGTIENNDVQAFLDKAYLDNTVGEKYISSILREIKKVTGIDVKYCLWLCDSIEDIKNEYDKNLNEFYEYDNGPIVLSNIGKAGKLYGYEEMPKPLVRIITDVDTDKGIELD